MADDGVSAALELILEEIAAVEEQLQTENQQAFKNEQFSAAKALADSATRLVAFRAKLRELRGEWLSCIDAPTRERVRVEPSYTISPHTKSSA
ncbi:MAG: hypothetical protein WBO97_14010, partial [Tepidiformaceae bacterium]